MIEQRYADGRELLVLGAKDVRDVTFSPDGKYVVTACTDGTTHIWDAETGDSINVLRGHAMNVTSVACSPDGKWIASASADRTIRIWDASTGVYYSVDSFGAVVPGPCEQMADVPEDAYEFGFNWFNRVHRINTDSTPADVFLAILKKVVKLH